MTARVGTDHVAQAAQLAPELARRAPEHDRDSTFPAEDYADLHRAGLLGLRIPQADGGAEVDDLTYVRVLEELATGSGATALTLNMHSSATALVARLGSEDQRRRWLRPVIERGDTFASLTSEPNVSLRHVRFGTTARRVPEGWCLDGRKYFASLAGFARSYLVFAAAQGEQDRSARRAFALLVRADNPGARVEPSWDAVGMRATSSHAVVFQDCLVPREDAVEIDLEREGNATDLYLIGYGGIFLGLAEAGYRLAVDYARTKRFGPDEHTIAHYPNIQRHVAEMTLQLDAMRLLVHRAAEHAGSAPSAERARLLLEAKWAGAIAARDVNDRALEVVGGAGIARRLPLERFIRDARAGVVMPPNLDACLDGIGRLTLGLDPPGGLFGST